MLTLLFDKILTSITKKLNNEMNFLMEIKPKTFLRFFIIWKYYICCCYQIYIDHISFSSEIAWLTKICNFLESKEYLYNNSKPTDLLPMKNISLFNLIVFNIFIKIFFFN